MLTRMRDISLLEALQHLLRDEAMAGVVEVVAVVGENAAPLVLGVVLLPVLDKCLAEIVHGHLLRLDDLTLDSRECVKLRIVLVRAVVLLADAGESALDNLDLFLLQAVDEFFEAGFEELLGNAASVV